MRVRGVNCRLIGAEGSCPPLPYIEVSDSEGAALIGRGHAEDVTGEDVAPAKAPEPKPQPKPQPEPKPEPKPEPEPEPEPEPKPNKVDEDRATLIADALDLVEGDVTAEAVADITGLTGVTIDEIAAAMKAKDAAE